MNIWLGQGARRLCAMSTARRSRLARHKIGNRRSGGKRSGGKHGGKKLVPVAGKQAPDLAETQAPTLNEREWSLLRRTRPCRFVQCGQGSDSSPASRDRGRLDARMGTSNRWVAVPRRPRPAPIDAMAAVQGRYQPVRGLGGIRPLARSRALIQFTKMIRQRPRNGVEFASQSFQAVRTAVLYPLSEAALCNVSRHLLDRLQSRGNTRLSLFYR